MQCAVSAVSAFAAALRRAVLCVCLVVLCVADDAGAGVYKDTANRMAHAGVFPSLPIAIPWSEDPLCRHDSTVLLDALNNRTLWAVQMLDSSASSAFGILDGNRYQLGNFDECLTGQQPLRTHFCGVQVRAYLPQDTGVLPEDVYDLDPDPNISVWTRMKMNQLDPSQNPRDMSVWGLCVPASCNATLLERGLNMFLNSSNNTNSTASYRVTIPSNFCVGPDKDPFTVSEVAFWGVCIFLVVLVAISTARDLLWAYDSTHKETSTEQLLSSFSLRRNVRTLLAVSKDEKPGPLLVFRGIKVATIILIIYDHRVAMFFSAAMLNVGSVEHELRGYNNLFLPNGDLQIDSFFFFGALIFTSYFLSVYKKGGSNFLFCIIVRLSRLIPLYFFLVWFHASALLRLGSGPGWKSIFKREVDACVDNWWANLLFIQNYVNVNKMCLIHSWYIPCDVHMLILAILLLLLVQNHRRIGMVLFVILTVVSTLIPGIITYLLHLKPNVIFYHDFLSNPRNDAVFEHVYIKTHARATVYLLGIASGYFLHRVRDSTKRIPWWASLCGTLLWLGLMFTPMVYGSRYYDPHRAYDRLESAIFASWRRTIWGVAWIVFILVHRFGTVPVVSSFFSQRWLVPYSKLTYGVYLVHFIIQMCDQSKAKIPMHFGIYDIFVKGTSDVSFSYAYAAVLYFLIEQPFKVLFRQLFFAKKISQIQLNIAQSQQMPPQIVTVKL